MSEADAKRVLLKRAKDHKISWTLFRELREEGRCAEWLAAHPLSRPTRSGYGYVYVLLNFVDVVLYVGQAINVEHRLYINAEAHRFSKAWWREVAKVRVYTYRRADYDEAERWLIQLLEPLYNKVKPKPRRETQPEALSIVEGVVDSGA